MHDDFSLMTRRELIRFATTTAMIVPFSLRQVLAQTSLKRTPEEIMGPFFPVGAEPIRAVDLTKGPTGRAQGQVINLMGRVINRAGDPVPGAGIEIWQANTHGRYTHPSDTNPAPLDPNFNGFAIQTADGEGRYRFKTIKPGSYPTGVGDWLRPPHIHFDVSGKMDRLVTQMYFPGEPLNDLDRILKETPRKEMLIGRVLPPTTNVEQDSIVIVWDVVLTRG
jgi:protocatechuate 3,4-dioxygenase beta subunit